MPTTILSRFTHCHKDQTTTTELAIGGYSPVSYFDVNAAEKGKPEFTAGNGGKTYQFTSAAQKSKFESMPEKYLPAFGGSCGYGHTVGKEFPVDPTNFKIVDGQLVLFLNTADVDALALWNKEGDGAWFGGRCMFFPITI